MKPQKKKLIREKFDVLKCQVCDNEATHSVTLELREQPGMPFETKVLYLACDDHVKNTNIEYWINPGEWMNIVNEWKRKGVFIKKQYSNIHMVKLED